MRRAPAFSVLTGLLLLATHQSALAQGGTLRGRVTDSTGAAVPAAVVSIDAAGLRAQTGEDGQYSVARVPSGTHTVRVRRIGFNAPPVRVTIREGEVTRQDFTLVAVPVALAGVEVVVGSRAQHTAADELAVPVDVFPLERIQQQGTTETAQILSQLAPSVNFQRQSVADASEIVRPFTMRGLSPDHTLVLINGKRQHHTAVVNYFGAGIGSGSSGVDMNALPASMVERIEVLRDGAASQYGSDAIAGVVNIVTKDGVFSPTLQAEGGTYYTNGAVLKKGMYSDGATVDVNGGWGIPLGRGSIDLFAEYRDRNPTNRAGADNSDQLVVGDGNSVDEQGRIVQQNNPVPMPNYHWGDGASKDIMTFLNSKIPLGEKGNSAFYAFGGYSHRDGTGFGYYRPSISERNWPQIYPIGFLPEFHPKVQDASAAAGVRGLAGKWTYDVGGSFGYNSFLYRLDHTLNASLGPCLDTPCAPGPDGILGTADDPGIPNKTSFDAGTVKLHEEIATLDLSREYEVGLPSPLTLSVGGAFRRENYQILAGEPASYIQGYHPDQYGNIAAAGSQVFPGLRPQDAVDASRNNVAGYVELESDIAPKVLAQVASRFEHYSDFGSQLTGKLALRYQPVKQWTFRGAVSNGFRAPSLSQSYYSQIATNFEADPNTGKPVPFEVGIFPVNSPEARALGAKPLKAEKSVNVSAGLAFSPQQNITFTADYYFITLKDRIQLSTAIQGDSVASILASIGSRATAAQYMTNAINTHTQGVDVTANFAFDVGRGKLNINPAFNWTQNKVTSLAPVPAALDGTGVTTLFDPFYEGGLLSLTDERPRWRGTITANYALAAWSFMARSLSFGQYKSALYSYSGDDVQTYKGQTIFDAEVGYLFRGVRLSLGARNLFDTYPGFMNPGNSFFIFPYPSASPYGFNGRYLYTRVELGVH